MRFSSLITKSLAVILSSVLLAQIALADAAQSNFWAERRTKIGVRNKALGDRTSDDITPNSYHLSPVQLASLPSSFSANPAQVFKELPSPKVQFPLPSAGEGQGEGEIPSIVQALASAYGTVREVSVPSRVVIPAKAGIQTGSPLTTRGDDHQRTVILIQDVHMNQEAQENIGKAVQELIDQGAVGLVGLEGATKPIDLEALRSFPYPEITKKVADYFLKENKITGPIHALLTYKSLLPNGGEGKDEGKTSVPLTPTLSLTGRGKSDIPPVIGVDDPQHYKANVEAYKQSAGRQAQYKAEIGRLQSELAKEKKASFNPALLEFDEQVEAYRKGTAKLGEYLRFLAHFPRPISMSVETFLAALDMEEHLDFSQVEKERSQVLQKLVGKLKKGQVLDLVKESLAYRLGRVSHAHFYTYLKDLCKSNGVNLSRYSSMDSYIRYILLSDSFKADQLFKEVSGMERRGYKTLAKTQKEKELVDQSKRLYLTTKLVDFSLTTGEWEEYKQISLSPIEGEGRVRGANLSPHPILLPHREKEFPGSLPSFEAFYREAETRNTAMIQNLLKAMEEHKASTAVLVAGGFHSQGIQDKLKELKVASLTFVPRITKVDTENGSKYLSVFTQEKTPLEKLFQGEKLFLGDNPFSFSVQVAGPAANYAAAVYAGQATANDSAIKSWVHNVTPGAQNNPTYQEQVAQEKATVHEVIVSPQGGQESSFNLTVSFGSRKGDMDNLNFEGMNESLSPVSLPSRFRSLVARVLAMAKSMHQRITEAMTPRRAAIAGALTLGVVLLLIFGFPFDHFIAGENLAMMAAVVPLGIDGKAATSIRRKLPSVNKIGEDLAREGLVKFGVKAFNQFEANCYVIASRIAARLGYELPSTMEAVTDLILEHKRYSLWGKRFGEKPLKPSPVNLIIREPESLPSPLSADYHVAIEVNGKEFNYGAITKNGYEISGRIPLRRNSEGNLAVPASIRGEKYARSAPYWEWIFQVPVLSSLLISNLWIAVPVAVIIAGIMAVIFAFAHPKVNDNGTPRKTKTLVFIGFVLGLLFVIPALIGGTSTLTLLYGWGANMGVHALYNEAILRMRQSKNPTVKAIGYKMQVAMMARGNKPRITTGEAAIKAFRGYWQKAVTEQGKVDVVENLLRGITAAEVILSPKDLEVLKLEVQRLRKKEAQVYRQAYDRLEPGDLDSLRRLIALPDPISSHEGNGHSANGAAAKPATPSAAPAKPAPAAPKTVGELSKEELAKLAAQLPLPPLDRITIHGLKVTIADHLGITSEQIDSLTVSELGRRIQEKLLKEKKSPSAPPAPVNRISGNTAASPNGNGHTNGDGQTASAKPASPAAVPDSASDFRRLNNEIRELVEGDTSAALKELAARLGLSVENPQVIEDIRLVITALVMSKANDIQVRADGENIRFRVGAAPNVNVEEIVSTRGAGSLRDIKEDEGNVEFTIPAKPIPIARGKTPPAARPATATPAPVAKAPATKPAQKTAEPKSTPDQSLNQPDEDFDRESLATDTQGKSKPTASKSKAKAPKSRAPEASEPAPVPAASAAETKAREAAETPKSLRGFLDIGRVANLGIVIAGVSALFSGVPLLAFLGVVVASFEGTYLLIEWLIYKRTLPKSGAKAKPTILGYFSEYAEFRGLIAAIGVAGLVALVGGLVSGSIEIRAIGLFFGLGGILLTAFHSSFDWVSYKRWLSAQAQEEPKETKQKKKPPTPPAPLGKEKPTPAKEADEIDAALGLSPAAGGQAGSAVGPASSVKPTGELTRTRVKYLWAAAFKESKKAGNDPINNREKYVTQAVAFFLFSLLQGGHLTDDQAMVKKILRFLQIKYPRELKLALETVRVSVKGQQVSLGDILVEAGLAKRKAVPTASPIPVLTQVSVGGRRVPLTTTMDGAPLDPTGNKKAEARYRIERDKQRAGGAERYYPVTLSQKASLSSSEVDSLIESGGIVVDEHGVYHLQLQPGEGWVLSEIPVDPTGKKKDEARYNIERDKQRAGGAGRYYQVVRTLRTSLSSSQVDSLIESGGIIIDANGDYHLSSSASMAPTREREKTQNIIEQSAVPVAAPGKTAAGTPAVVDPKSSPVEGPQAEPLTGVAKESAAPTEEAAGARPQTNIDDVLKRVEVLIADPNASHLDKVLNDLHRRADQARAQGSPDLANQLDDAANRVEQKMKEANANGFMRHANEALRKLAKMTGMAPRKTQTAPTPAPPKGAAEGQPARQSIISNVAVSPDGKTAAFAHNDGTLTIRDVETGKERRVGPFGNHNDQIAGIHSIGFSPDGETVAVGTEGVVHLWNVRTGNQRGTLKGNGSFVDSVAFSPDGKTMAFGDREDGTVQLWNVKEKKLLWKSLPGKGHFKEVSTLAFSPDGKLLASGSYDGKILFWDVKEGIKKGKAIECGEKLHAIAFSSDGRILASVKELDPTIHLWNVATRQEDGKPLEHNNKTTSRIAFSPERESGTLVSTMDDGTLLIWDLKQRKVVAERSEQELNRIHAIGFSADGQNLTVANHEGKARSFPLKPQKQKPAEPQTAPTTKVVERPTLSWVQRVVGIINWIRRFFSKPKTVQEKINYGELRQQFLVRKDNKPLTAQQLSNQIASYLRRALKHEDWTPEDFIKVTKWFEYYVETKPYQAALEKPFVLDERSGKLVEGSITIAEALKSRLNPPAPAVVNELPLNSQVNGALPRVAPRDGYLPIIQGTEDFAILTNETKNPLFARVWKEKPLNRANTGKGFKTYALAVPILAEFLFVSTSSGEPLIKVIIDGLTPIFPLLLTSVIIGLAAFVVYRNAPTLGISFISRSLFKPVAVSLLGALLFVGPLARAAVSPRLAEKAPVVATAPQNPIAAPTLPTPAQQAELQGLLVRALDLFSNLDRARREKLEKAILDHLMAGVPLAENLNQVAPNPQNSLSSPEVEPVRLNTELLGALKEVLDGEGFKGMSSDDKARRVVSVLLPILRPSRAPETRQASGVNVKGGKELTQPIVRHFIIEDDAYIPKTVETIGRFASSSENVQQRQILIVTVMDDNMARVLNKELTKQHVPRTIIIHIARAGLDLVGFGRDLQVNAVTAVYSALSSMPEFRNLSKEQQGDLVELMKNIRLYAHDATRIIRNAEYVLEQLQNGGITGKALKEILENSEQVLILLNKSAGPIQSEDVGKSLLTLEEAEIGA